MRWIRAHAENLNLKRRAIGWIAIVLLSYFEKQSIFFNGQMHLNLFFASAEASELTNVQKQLTDCKSELAEIIESKEALGSAIQHLETALDESKKEKAELVDSKKKLAIELEVTKKKLTKKCEAIDAQEEKCEYVSQQNGAARTQSTSNPSTQYASQGACAIPKGKVKGTLQFPKHGFSSASHTLIAAGQSACAHPKSEEEGTL